MEEPGSEVFNVEVATNDNQCHLTLARRRVGRSSEPEVKQLLLEDWLGEQNTRLAASHCVRHAKIVVHRLERCIHVSPLVIG